VEHLRSWSPRCAGSVVWQLNDCWPVTSWAAVDGDERPKPLLYALGHAHADRLVTVQPREGGLAVVVVNDTATPWQGDLVVRRLGFDGTERASAVLGVDAPARGTLTVELQSEEASGVVTGVAAKDEVVVAELDGVRGLWFFAEPRDSALAPPELSTHVDAVDGGYDVVVTAANLVRDVALLVDKVHPDARVDDQMVTLLPGETARFAVRVPDGTVLDVEAFAGAAVLRSLNQLVGGRR
jgi:beta-mannosidase